MQSSLNNLIKFGLNSAFEYLTNIPIAIAEIFLPDVTVVIMQMSSPVHKVDVYEVKYKKYIYLLETSYILASIVEKTEVRYENYVMSSAPRVLGENLNYTYYTNWYNRAEERAYLSYQVQPYKESILGYEYGNAIIISVVV